jgi:hypothetical protein
MTEESSPAADLMRLATAYQASAALHAAVRLGIADALDPGPRSVAGIADAIGGNVHAAALRRLLRALVALGVVEEAPRGTFALSAAGRTLATGTPGSLRDLVLFFGHADMWRSWIELERCIRTGQTAGMLLFGSEDPFARYATDPDFGPVFNRGMTANSVASALAITRAYDFSAFRQVVDIGGGQGRLLAAILAASPSTRGILYDLPSVVAGAGPVLSAAGVTDRCEVVSGDMFSHVPDGGDLYVLMRVLHDWDDACAVEVLQRCRQAAQRPGVRLLVAERVLRERMTCDPRARSDALADLNMLVRTGGRERTEDEFRALLKVAGWKLQRVIVTSGPVSLIEATP